jgi:hypothetical protein
MALVQKLLVPATYPPTMAERLQIRMAHEKAAINAPTEVPSVYTRANQQAADQAHRVYIAELANLKKTPPRNRKTAEKRKAQEAHLDALHKTLNTIEMNMLPVMPYAEKEEVLKDAALVAYVKKIKAEKNALRSSSNVP